MEHQLHYDTVINAIAALKKKGFTVDFNMEDNYIVSSEDKIHVDDFSIVDVYRYEGNSDPSDEAAVYAIECKNGLKGILVSGYGPSADTLTTEMLQKLRIK
ncbi:MULTISPECIES: hypothetical protein [unclassified Chitinophaga]|uniref:hypothetical protein n=1 Tax=unclassified Chitinophaga TaxID=2619133 RepID=UPI0009CD9CB6|nr:MULTISPECIES: hypothetical protein [unclassified Chitinophaga]OMP79145.1 hypothetical protein BW716_11030 [[Flexibacter] sp. ATCC 35208]WPV68039.1 hypothetical protein QQL36_04785 [Chitinophaga sp. LS1]